MENAIPKNEKSDSRPLSVGGPGESDIRDQNPSSWVARRAVERRLEGRRSAYAAEVQRLIDAGFEVIRETGALEPRVSEILEVAGLSNQTFYKHFRSKDELLVAILDAGVQQLRGYLIHRMSTAGDPLDGVREWLRGMLAQALDETAANATRPFALSRARLADRFPVEVDASERALTDILRDELTRARSGGWLQDGDPERDAEMLYDLAMGWVQRRLLSGGAGSSRDAERLVTFAIKGLGPIPRDDGEGGAARDEEDSDRGT